MACKKCGHIEVGLVHNCSIDTRRNWILGVILFLVFIIIVAIVTTSKSAEADHTNQAITCYEFNDSKAIVDAEADMTKAESLAFREELTDGVRCGLAYVPVGKMGKLNFLYSRQISETSFLSIIRVVSTNNSVAYAIVMKIITLEDEPEGESI